jgi:hypothetical protein
MGLLEKAKAAAEQAATMAKEGVEDVQAKRELSQAYNELGKATFELIESGGVVHPGLDAAAAKVRAAVAKVAPPEADADADADADAAPPA